ncbi:hypothetical protein BD410DRAFT_783164 [Rickenella mellea]|uniref:ATPase inhibitor, mitochondrial n=1 Tax=Rickenella mellea TaxID=50990 RepID=A0A4Y7QID5_9AGAM|nr:hypothetical protein BD410DRAFT_783164 [Rickenella mellea]
MFAALPARRLSALPRTLRRAYSEGHGSVASSKGSFSKKEKAHEDQYARQTEERQLKKLREQIELKKRELENLQKEHDQVEEVTKTK